MRYLFAMPAMLSLLVLAAHFLRMALMPMVLVSLALIVLMMFRRNWVTRLVQVYLLLAALEWLRALMMIIDERHARQMPWKKAAIIMLSVEAFTILSAILLQWFIRPRMVERTEEPA